MKNIIILLFTSTFSFSQIDTIKTSIYTSIFDNSLKQVLYVKYDLYRGGGDCDRKSLTFKEYENTLSNKDYVGSGLDKGHLANAEDFADICQNQKFTFDFYNIIPQYPNLNRGVWKHHEDSLRQLSQHNALIIVCGGVYLGKKIKNINVPVYCFKICLLKSTKKVIFSKLYSNYKLSNWNVNITVNDLEKLTSYKLQNDIYK